MEKSPPAIEKVHFVRWVILFWAIFYILQSQNIRLHSDFSIYTLEIRNKIFWPSENFCVF